MNNSSWGRLIGVLFAPGETFRSIAERPTWLPPLIVLVLLGVGLQTFLELRTDPERQIRDQAEAFGIELTQEQVDKGLEEAEKAGPGAKVAGVVLGTVLAAGFYFLLALFFWVGFKMFGSESSYFSSVATVVHGMIPLGIAVLLSFLVALGNEEVGFKELMSGEILASNLGLLAPEDAGRVVKTLLQSVDLFSIWTIVLLVIGYQATARVSKATAMGIVLAIWLMGIGLKVGFIALMAALVGGGT